MQKLMGIIKKIGAKMILGKKDKIITALNAKLDLPFLNEKDEKELLEGIWETIEEVVGEAIQLTDKK